MSEVHIPTPPVDEGELLRGRIVTGMQLSVAAQKRIARHFEELLGCRVHLTCRLDKKLLAGVRVELGGRCYDGSLQAQLMNAQKMLKRHEEDL